MMGFLLLFGLPAFASGDWQPTLVRLFPDRVQALEDSYAVWVDGVPPETTVWLQVLRSCGAAGSPDFQPRGECRPEMGEPWTVRASAAPVRTTFTPAQVPPLASLSGADPALLWLRASAVRGGPGPIVQFGVRGTPCAALDRLYDLFGGACAPAFTNLLAPSKGTANLPDAPQAVYLAAADDPASRRRLDGTRGATGFSWVDGEAFLLTMDDGPVPGLFRATLANDRTLIGPPILVARLPDGAHARAPMALSGGRWVVAVAATGDAEEWTLDVGEGEGVVHRMRVGAFVLEILGAHGDAVVVHGLAGGSTPVLLLVDVGTGQIETLPYDPGLVAGLRREPGATRSAVYAPSANPEMGWDVFLVDGDGRPSTPIRVGVEGFDVGVDDWLPAWRPGTHELAWLGEVSGGAGGR